LAINSRAMLTIALTGAARADQTMIDVAAFGVDAVDCQPAVVVQAVEDRADVLFTLGATVTSVDDERQVGQAGAVRPPRRPRPVANVVLASRR
jgi:hypothetical protein